MNTTHAATAVARTAVAPDRDATTPQERHAATVLASTAPSARKAVACNLRRAAAFAIGHATDAAYPWHRADPATLAKVRADLRDGFEPATANASIAAVPGRAKGRLDGGRIWSRTPWSGRARH